MAKKNPINVPMREFSEKYMARATKYVRVLNIFIAQGMPVEEAVNKAWTAVNYGELIKDSTVEGMIKAVAIGGGPVAVASGGIIRKSILDKWVSLDGRKLSTALYKNEKVARQIITNELQAQLKLNRSYKYAAQFLQDTGKFTADAPKYLQDVATAGRRVFAGDLSAQKELADSIAYAQRQVNKLSAAGNTDALKITYQNLIDKANQGTAKALEKAIERAVLQKARYQAERLARTEIAYAYGDAKTAEIQADEDATGIQWALSGAHYGYDICDFHASADLHGMGEGVYLKSTLPPYPAHPHCQCLLRPFYKDMKQIKSVDSKAAIEFIDKLPDHKKAQLLGASGSESFGKNPKDWKNLVKNYQPEVTKKPQIKL